MDEQQWRDRLKALSEEPGDATVISLLEARMGARVIFDRAIPKDRIYLVPRSLFAHQPLGLYSREDLDPRFEAVAIVQEGMAEIVSWLRAAGHDMPNAWVQQDDYHREQRRRRRGMLYDAAMPSGPIINPRSFVAITSVL